MRRTIHFDPQDIEDDDTICGYHFKDILAFAAICQIHGVSNEDIKRFVSEYNKAYQMAINDFIEQSKKTYQEIFKDGKFIGLKQEIKSGGADDAVAK